MLRWPPLGFHIILACFGIAFPTVVLVAEYRGLRRSDDAAMLLARRWSQVMAIVANDASRRELHTVL